MLFPGYLTLKQLTVPLPLCPLKQKKGAEAPKNYSKSKIQYSKNQIPKF